MQLLVEMRIALLLAALAVAAAATDSTPLSLELGKTVDGKIAWGDTAVFCYTAPQFNIWRIFHEVTINVAASKDGVPSVYGASRDDVHGIIDSYVKARIVGGDVDHDISERARSRGEYFATPLDLLSECPPIWDSTAQHCAKAFSPFGRSCVAVTMRKRSDKDKNIAFQVTANAKFQKALPVSLAVGAAVLYLARFLAKSKVVWYTSGVSLSIFAGLLILIIFTCRKIKVPGTSNTGFTVISAMGYGAVWVRYIASTLRAAAAKYWEFLAVYCAIFAVIGFVHIARIRRSEEKKHDFRILVLWSLRFLALVFISRGSRSSFINVAMIGSLLVYYVITRFAIGASSKGDYEYHDAPRDSKKRR